MPAQARLAGALRAAGQRRRLLVGGAPAIPAWAAAVGAEHAEDARRAVPVALSPAARGG